MGRADAHFPGEASAEGRERGESARVGNLAQVVVGCVDQRRGVYAFGLPDIPPQADAHFLLEQKS